jgi:hypothetical protein
VRMALKAWKSVRVLCVGSGLATGSSPVQGVLPTVYRIKKIKNLPKFQQKDCRTIEKIERYRYIEYKPK